MADKIPVLFDTDIGSDIDDAVALAYLLSQPRCELLGITTVSGEPGMRASLADAVCRAAGRTDVPIHSGIGTPLMTSQKQREAPQKSVLPNWAHQPEFPSNTAVPFLRDMIRSRPGEVTLLAVGPFTNVATLFAMDPEIPQLLSKLVIMGGVYTTRVAGCPRTEWNASCDPHAAAIMFSATSPELIAYGLDVTLRCTMDSNECRAKFVGGALDVVAEMAEVWYGRSGHITFHDPLAAVSLFEPEICSYTSGVVEVELLSPRVAGMTHWTVDPDGPHTVATDVHAAHLFESYFGVFQH